jgi:hypothetical protein
MHLKSEAPYNRRRYKYLVSTREYLGSPSMGAVPPVALDLGLAQLQGHRSDPLQFVTIDWPPWVRGSWIIHLLSMYLKYSGRSDGPKHPCRPPS